MKQKEGFKLRKVGKEYMITADSVSNIDFNSIVSFNSSAAFLWQSVEGKEFTAEDLAALLEGEYGLNHDYALSEANKTVEFWGNAGLIVE